MDKKEQEAVYALLILFCIGSADCHPVHDGMTEAESKILCSFATFALGWLFMATGVLWYWK